MPRWPPAWAQVVLAFLAARLAAAAALVPAPAWVSDAAWGDLATYESWVAGVGGAWAVPSSDTWMYPPGAAALLAVPAVLPLPYPVAFVALAAVLDAAVLAMLLVAGGRLAGAWVWALLAPLLGVVLWARIDVAAVAAVVAALLWAGRRPRIAGAAAALGAAVKAWPVLLVAVLWRNRPWLLSGVLSGAVLIALSLPAAGAFDFVGRLASRGLQVESVPATPWLLGQAAGFPFESGYANGSIEITSAGAGAVAAVGTLAAVAAVFVAWRVSAGWAPATRWWAMVVALLASGTLLSVQFILWIVGASAVAAAVPGEHGHPVRRTLPLTAVVVLLSGAAFPWQWEALIGNRGQVGAALAAATVALRNIALVGLVAWSWVLLRRGPSPAAVVGEVPDPGPDPAWR